MISIINQIISAVSSNLTMVCVTAIVTAIGLALLPELFVHTKAENNVTISVKKGEALYDLGNYTGAILYYDKALAINPHNIDALNSKGWALDSLGNHTGAILYYDKALATEPHNFHVLSNKGLALDNLGNHTGAIEYYDKALAVDPNY